MSGETTPMRASDLRQKRGVGGQKHEFLHIRSTYSPCAGHSLAPNLKQRGILYNFSSSKGSENVSQWIVTINIYARLSSATWFVIKYYIYYDHIQCLFFSCVNMPEIHWIEPGSQTRQRERVCSRSRCSRRSSDELDALNCERVGLTEEDGSPARLMLQP